MEIKTIISEDSANEVNAIVIDALKEMLDNVYCEDNTVTGHLFEINAVTAALLDFNKTRDVRALWHNLQEANVDEMTLSCVSDYDTVTVF